MIVLNRSVQTGDTLKIKSDGAFYTTHSAFCYNGRRCPVLGELVRYSHEFFHKEIKMVVLISTLDDSVFYMSSNNPEDYLEYEAAVVNGEIVKSISTHGVDIHVVSNSADRVDQAIKKIESAFFPERTFKIGDRFKVGLWEEHECVLIQVRAGVVQFICVKGWNRYSDATHNVKDQLSIRLSELSLGAGVFITPL